MNKLKAIPSDLDTRTQIDFRQYFTNKSYVIRTHASKPRALAADFIVSHDTIGKIFFNLPGSKILDIGFGDGHTLLDKANKNLASHYLGVEVYEQGIHSLARSILKTDPADSQNSKPKNNIYIYQGDVIELLFYHCLPKVFDQIHIHFPDPWPKTRHMKRRLITPFFLQLCSIVLKEKGLLHILTDHENYAQFIQQSFAAYHGELASVELWAQKLLSRRKTVKTYIQSLYDFAKAQKNEQVIPKALFKSIDIGQQHKRLQTTLIPSKYHKKSMREGRKISAFLYQKITAQNQGEQNEKTP